MPTEKEQAAVDCRGCRWIFAGAIGVLAGLALPFLAYQFWRLIWYGGRFAAVDVRMRLLETQHFFQGRDVYWELSNAVYPPASYLMLWPLLGWLDAPAARWLWAVFTLACLWLMVALNLRYCGPPSSQERAVVGLSPLALYATGACVGNGQLGIAVVLCLMAGLPLLGREERSWGRDTVIALLVLGAMVKPSMSVFFFWIVIFAGASLRPALLTVGTYTAFTAVASLFQPTDPVRLMQSWLLNSMKGVAYGAAHGEGAINFLPGGQLRIISINLHSLLSLARLQGFNASATLILLVLLGIWIYFHRRGSLWALIGLSALVARFAIYHGWYDDIVLLLPLIALYRAFRLEKWVAPVQRRTAGVLCTLMLITSLAPGGVYALPHPWNNAWVTGQAVVSLSALIFLGVISTRTPPESTFRQ